MISCTHVACYNLLPDTCVPLLCCCRTPQVAQRYSMAATLMLRALGANWRVMASLALALPAPAAPTEAAAAAARAPAVIAEPAPAPAAAPVAPAAAPVVPAAAPVAPAPAAVVPAAAPVAPAPAAVAPAAAPVAPAAAPLAPAPAPAALVTSAAAAAAAAAAACFDLPPALSKVSGGGSGAFGAFVHSQLRCCKLQVQPNKACAVLRLRQHPLPMRSSTLPTDSSVCTSTSNTMSTGC
jgi:hypothetical protein